MLVSPLEIELYSSQTISMKIQPLPSGPWRKVKKISWNIEARDTLVTYLLDPNLVL